MDQGSRTAAKVVVGILGGLYLIAGLGLTAFSAFLALDDPSRPAAKVVLYSAAALAIWVLLTGIGAVVVGMEAEEAVTAWLGGLGVLALGVVIAGAYAVWFFTKP